MSLFGLITNRRHALGQIIVCQGCCCGRVDRGKPEVPVEQFKSIWRQEKLNTSIQLTISGCLGPCDLCNVVVVVTPSGMTWLGGLTEPEQYQLLIDWVRGCRAAGQLLPLPVPLRPHQFQRFAG